MPLVEPTEAEVKHLNDAYDEARAGYKEDHGIPVGAALYEGNQPIARGRNRLIQNDDPLLHAETDCIRNAYHASHGLIDYTKTTLYTSLSPCPMCAGTIIRFGIPRVVIGDNRPIVIDNDKSFEGEIGYLLLHGIEVAIVEHDKIQATFEEFMSEPKNRQKFLKDTGGKF